MITTIKKDVIENIYHISLTEETTLLGSKRYTILVERNNSVESTQVLEALDVALAVYEGLLTYYERQISVG